MSEMFDGSQFINVPWSWDDETQAALSLEDPVYNLMSSHELGLTYLD